jgi:hypothetical protein
MSDAQRSPAARALTASESLKSPMTKSGSTSSNKASSALT